MNEKRQTSIGLTPKEKASLEKGKHLYEQKTGDKLVNSSKKNPTTTCVVCGQKFSIAYSEDLPPVAYVTCPNPNCQAELVVDFSAP